MDIWSLIFICFALYKNYYVNAIVCHQCNGWRGKNQNDKALVSTCDNLNNQCDTTQFCVKIVDPMRKNSPYTTFKSDCYYQNTLQVSPNNLTQIQSNTCYAYQDNSTPPKRWLYCFCNNRDYCNAANKIFTTSQMLIFFIFTIFTIKF